MLTLIILNDHDGTYIRTNTAIYLISKNFQIDGYSLIVDTEGREHIITPKCISYICQKPTNEAVCEGR